MKSLPLSSAPSPGLPPGTAIADREWDDVELARRVAARDDGAFVVLMRRHNRLLYQAARSVLKDEAESEDAVQDAYLLAYRMIGGFRGEAKLSTWLVRIVINEAIARSRKRSRSEALAIRLDRAADVNEAAPEPPERIAERAETRLVLQAAIDSLPDAFRRVFVLRALQEMSVEEVAGVLGIPEVTVRTRFFRARRLLRATLPRGIELSFANLFPFAGERCAGIVAAVLVRLRHSPRSVLKVIE